MKEFWTDKRVLITGGAGYLAFSLLNLLKDQTASILRLDRPGADFFPMVGKADIRNVEVDIRDSNVWKNLLPNVDVIFHLAAQTSSAQSDADPTEDRGINVDPVVSLIETCQQMQVVPAVVFAGTATECGLTDVLPVNEAVPDHPITMYDRHKLVAENELKKADAAGVLKAATLRLANLYGPGPRSSRADRGILNLMVRRALSGESVTVYGTGAYVRDYLFVEDAARAFVVAAECIESTHGQHFLVGSEEGTTIREAFELVAKRVTLRNNLQVDVQLVEPPSPLPAIETRNFVADTTRFKQRTDWCSSVDLKTGIDRTIEFYEHD